MSITLTNPSTTAIDTAKTKAGKRDNLFTTLTGDTGGEEATVGLVSNKFAYGAGDATDPHNNASHSLATMQAALDAHASYTVAALATANVSAIEYN